MHNTDSALRTALLQLAELPAEFGGNLKLILWSGYGREEPTQVVLEIQGQPPRWPAWEEVHALFFGAKPAPVHEHAPQKDTPRPLLATHEYAGGKAPNSVVSAVLIDTGALLELLNFVTGVANAGVRYDTGLDYYIDRPCSLCGAPAGRPCPEDLEASHAAARVIDEGKTLYDFQQQARRILESTVVVAPVAGEGGAPTT